MLPVTVSKFEREPRLADAAHSGYAHQTNAHWLPRGARRQQHFFEVFELAGAWLERRVARDREIGCGMVCHQRAGWSACEFGIRDQHAFLAARVGVGDHGLLLAWHHGVDIVEQAVQRHLPLWPYQCRLLAAQRFEQQPRHRAMAILFSCCLVVARRCQGSEQSRSALLHFRAGDLKIVLELPPQFLERMVGPCADVFAIAAIEDDQDAPSVGFLEEPFAQPVQRDMQVRVFLHLLFLEVGATQVGMAYLLAQFVIGLLPMSAEVEQQKVIGAALAHQFKCRSLDTGARGLLTEQGKGMQRKLAALHKHVRHVLGIGTACLSAGRMEEQV